jgi:type II secretory pathway pseudopilin PulG
MKLNIKSTQRGFALVATLSLMVLLAILAVGMLSLSAVSRRSSGQANAQTEARANARMALMMAIGELQRSTGPDTRITAPANIVDENYPQILGVWRSWEGTNHEANGRPTVPNYASKGKSESEGGRFIDWLVSSADAISEPGIGDAPSLVSNSASGSTVPLLADGSLQSTDFRQIHVVPSKIRDGGRYAWWVSGENQKAVLSQPYKPRTDDAAGLVERGQSHSVANPAVFGLHALLSDPEPHHPVGAEAKRGRKAISRQTMAVIDAGNATEPGKKFHDLSAYSIGLLTNTATGGWRKDMSILTERWDAIYASYPGGRLPLFRYAPTTGSTSQVPKPVRPTTNIAPPSNNAAMTAATPPMSNLYPWSDYSLIIGYTQPGTYHAASASWASLQNFATSYKSFSNYNGTVKSPFSWAPITKTANNEWNAQNAVRIHEIFDHKHRQRLHPQIARFQFLVYARAYEWPLDRNPKTYAIQLMYVPYFTLWNPYNVTLEHTISGTTGLGGLPESERVKQTDKFLGFGFSRSVPGAMAIVRKDLTPNPDAVTVNQYRRLNDGNFHSLDGGSTGGADNGLAENARFGGRWPVDARSWACWLPEGTITFKPGEAKIFSVNNTEPGYGFGGTAFRLREGFDPGSISGLQFNAGIWDNPPSRNFWFLFRSDRVTKPYRNRNAGVGFALSFGTGGSHFGGTSGVPSGIGPEYHNMVSLSSLAQGDKYWPPDELDEVSYSVAELASGPWIPLFSVNFGPRMTIGNAPGTVFNRPTKGVLQSNALAGMVLSDPGSGAAKDHPANNAYEFAYQSLSMGSTVTPNLSSSAAYIATGHQSGDGLSRLIMCDLPLRPMASLVELQGWNPRGHNPYPPFQMNLIGNSDATPLIPMDRIVPQALSPSGVDKNLMHDDAYCANHLLFDDWFLSSIAPEPETSYDMATIYTEFLKGERQLVNRSYRPIAADSKVTDEVATKRIGDVINSHDGWLKVASRFEVEGMFNVNSTSVEAWKALFGHARSLDRIAMHGADGLVETNTSSKHAVTRGAVATDVEAGTGKGFGGQFDLASEYTGFRTLSDEQIDDLAEKVVEQVRLRGPFLSLSEFVNRQLSSDKELALAGAIQSALDKLEEDPMAKLRDPNNALSDETMPPGDAKLAGVGYEFKEAAEGGSAYGAPGWIRQADILRPIAPIISVRDDTFTIRAYGDSLDQGGKVIAAAWCEAVVKRTRDFSDKSDAADSINPPANSMNATYGRRYEIISFRWLNADEV